MKILIISGPTASGKSSLALKIAALRDVAIINADALQIYQGLPILSSQPTENDMNSVAHFLYSYFKYSENCSVGIWLKLVFSSVSEALCQNKIPVIVGGTGMYISKLVEGISEVPEIDNSIRSEALIAFEEMGRDKFIQKLISFGEDEFKINKLDKQRLTRVYEVFRQTKKSLFWWQNQPKKQLFDKKVFVHLNLNPSREILYKNCDLRFNQMLKNGALEEVKSLIRQGVNSDYQISKTLGFLEIKDFLENKISQEKAVEIAAQKTRNYAKRQLTWFRNQFQGQIIFEERNIYSNNFVDKAYISSLLSL